jgi:predicted dehydrogenase
MNPIRVAIAGCGRISGPHQTGYRGRRDAKIVAVCDNKVATENGNRIRVILDSQQP